MHLKNINIRRANIEDLQTITDIYNYSIVNSVATFDTQEKNLDQQEKWFNQHGALYPIFVASLNNILIGWTSISRWSDRCAYDKTGETSTYIHHEYRGQGVGKKLLSTSLEHTRENGFRNILARIASNQNASVALHEKLGFTLVGTMNQVGEKFGKIHDVHLFQHLLQAK